MDIDIQKFREGDWFVKFFSRLEYAQMFYDLGRMQLCPLKYFIGLEKQGRGDKNEGIIISKTDIVGKGILYQQKTPNSSYEKIASFDELRANRESLVFCITDLPKSSYVGESFSTDLKIFEDFGDEVKEIYAVFVDNSIFESRLIEYCKKHNISLAYGHIEYNDNAFTPQEILQILGNDPCKHYFRKSTAFCHQHEYRYVVRNTTENFIVQTQAIKTPCGYTIDIGCFNDNAFVAKITHTQVYCLDGYPTSHDT